MHSCSEGFAGTGEGGKDTRPYSLKRFESSIFFLRKERTQEFIKDNLLHVTDTLTVCVADPTGHFISGADQVPVLFWI